MAKEGKGKEQMFVVKVAEEKQKETCKNMQSKNYKCDITFKNK